jgi:hypothetical protein
MLVAELGVDCGHDGRAILAAGREEWRRSQARTVVRDAPHVAVDALRRLGYTVTEPLDGPPAGNPGRVVEY